MSTADHAGRPVRPSSAGRGPYSDGGNAGPSRSGGDALRRIADGGSTSAAPSRETTRPVPAAGGAAGGSSSGSASTSAIPKYPAGYTSRTGDEAGVAREQAREALRERQPATQPQPQQPPVQREAQPNGQPAPPPPTVAVATTAAAPVAPPPEAHPVRRSEGQAPAPVRPAPSRRVRLTVSRIDPWSAMKMSFLLSVALGIAGVVMVAVLWTVLEGMGVFDQVNGVIGQVIQDEGQGFDILDFVGFTRVVSLSIVIGVVDVILITAIATLGAFLYNVSSALVGGVQLTLTDD